MSNDKRRLLLVEDHADTAEALSRLLAARGYDVETARTYHAALKLGQSKAFDLLLVDLGLPDGDGKDLLKELRARGPVQAIAITGYATEDDKRQCQEAGFVAHIAKPHTSQVMLELIDRVVGNQS